MSSEKSRREFLQSASLAGAAIVAGAAGLSAGGCAGNQATGKQVEFKVDESGNGTLTIQDPKLAQEIFDQLRNHGELSKKFNQNGKKFVNTKGSPDEPEEDGAQGASFSMASTEAASEYRFAKSNVKGVTVVLTADDKEDPNDPGTVTVNSLCGC
jgi:hypothetical protein